MALKPQKDPIADLNILCQMGSLDAYAPSLRQWQCPQCKAVHIRDENAAFNGLRKVLRDFPTKIEGETPSLVSGSDLAFVKERWAWCILPSGVRVMPRGQNGEHIRSTKKLNRENDISRSKADHLIRDDQV